MPRWGISNKLSIEHSQYHRAQREAYNQFADSFEVQDGGRDLHVYKNGNFKGLLGDTSMGVLKSMIVVSKVV